MKVAIVGLGTIGLRHLTMLDALPCVEVAAVADPRLGDGDVPGVRTFASYEQMLDSVALNAVVLSTPSWLHAEQGVLAAERGIHVISEKPMATTLAGADELLAACARNDVRLAVLHQHRFSGALLALKESIDNNRLGNLTFVNLHFHWRRDRDYYAKDGGWRGTWTGDGGGALMNQGSHAVDLARWLGGPIDSVSAMTANVEHEIEAEDTVCVTLRFARGGLGTIQVTTCASRNEPIVVQVQGTEAAATVVGRSLSFDGGASVEIEPDVMPHRSQFEHIFSMLTEGAAPSVDGDDARQTLADTMAMYEAATRGVTVSCVTPSTQAG